MEITSKMANCATANPEGGDYSVTPMDGAMLTRMLHTHSSLMRRYGQSGHMQLR